MTVWWNDLLLDAQAISLPFQDGTYLRGEGVFETIRALEGEPLYFDNHFKRLQSAAAALGFEPPAKEVLLGRIVTLLRHHDLAAARVRITLGENCLITAEPLPEGEGNAPLIAVTAPHHPINERSPLAGFKCTSYAENLLILRSSGAHEALRPNTRGELCEACCSNLFFVKNGRIFTPALDTGCLPGVMRRQVIAQIEVEEGHWPLAVLKEADEVWLSNSLKKIRAITDLDGKSLAPPSNLFRQISGAIL